MPKRDMLTTIVWSKGEHAKLKRVAAMVGKPMATFVRNAALAAADNAERNLAHSSHTTFPSTTEELPHKVDTPPDFQATLDARLEQLLSVIDNSETDAGAVPITPVSNTETEEATEADLASFTQEDFENDQP